MALSVSTAVVAQATVAAPTGQRTLAATQQQMESFKNAFAVCLEAKGYMVRF